ncbi:hypothetical protein GDO78_012889 [Eleutherodactylus coqui]|uniref:Uncharacterized protein n=1 Tax=Eleutherodactylus coqui TaxID=57060 RepID=A0A8J6EY89_ELECQ|nr:hypothetical protein GDO78_012889 [Eleutherodactylus coqui]
MQVRKIQSQFHQVVPTCLDFIGVIHSNRGLGGVNPVLLTSPKLPLSRMVPLHVEKEVHSPHWAMQESTQQMPRNPPFILRCKLCSLDFYHFKAYG